MYQQSYAVKLTGATALLVHQDNISWAEVMKKYEKDPANKKLSVAGDDRTPAWRWIGYAYFDDGKMVIPSDNLMTMLREGGSKCPTGKKGATFKRQTQSGIVVNQLGWPLLGAKGEILEKDVRTLIENSNYAEHEAKAIDLGFELFAKRARVGNNKHIRVRPKFTTWSCAGTLTVFDETIETSVLQDILSHAGRFAGLCDWRPSSPKSPGPYGTFTASVKEI